MLITCQDHMPLHDYRHTVMLTLEDQKPHENLFKAVTLIKNSYSNLLFSLPQYLLNEKFKYASL